MSEQGQSVEQLQAEIEAARSRLSRTIDELTYRAQPQQIVARQTEAAKASLMAATHDDDGGLRVVFLHAGPVTFDDDGGLRIERIAAVLAVVAALAIGLGLLRRRRG